MEDYKKKREDLLVLLSNSPSKFKGLSKEQQMDIDLVLDALEMNVGIFRYVDKKYKRDYEFCCMAVSKNANCLELFEDKFKLRRDVALAAVRKNGLKLGALPAWQSDKQVVCESIKSNPFAYKYVGLELRGDIEVLNCLFSHESSTSFVVETYKLLPTTIRYSGFADNTSIMVSDRMAGIKERVKEEYSKLLKHNLDIELAVETPVARGMRVKV